MPKLSATVRKGDDAKFKSVQEELTHENRLIDAKTARLRAARLSKATGEKHGPDLPAPDVRAETRSNSDQE